jgi:hypothetical protein
LISKEQGKFTDSEVRYDQIVHLSHLLAYADGEKTCIYYSKQLKVGEIVSGQILNRVVIHCL